MYIKESEYEQIAFVIFKKWLDSGRKFKDNKDYNDMINRFLPEKFNDENTGSNFWTKHNEKKLRSYLDQENYRRALK